MTTLEFVIRGNSEIMRRTITETPVAISPTSMHEYLDTASRHYASVFPIAERPASLHLNNAYSLASVELATIRLRCPFRLTDGSLSPVFASRQVTATGSAIADPFLDLIWKVPDCLRVLFVLRFSIHGGTKQVLANEPYLFVQPTEDRTRFYLLPLPNVYEDGRVCLGSLWDDRSVFTTIQSALSFAIETLNAAPWNTDLIGEMDEADCRALFRFAPADFRQLAPDAAFILALPQRALKVATALTEVLI